MKYLLLLIPLFICQIARAQDATLPHYMTDEEKTLYENYQPPVPLGRFIPEPPPGPVRAMAEWEELQGIMIAWTSFQLILAQIVNYAQEEGLVYIVCSDSNSVKNYLTSHLVPLTNLVYLEAPFNTIWIRDYGPWTAYSDMAGDLNIIDWIYNRPRPYDDLIPVVLADYIDVPIYEAIQPPNDLIHTGGNFFVDGHGSAFSSELILEENPNKTEDEIDAIIAAYLGIERYVKMETLPYDVIHHIDMHMKLLDEETLLVGQYPLGVADGPQIEENLEYLLSNFQSCYGRPYNVVRILMPPGPNGQYPNAGDDYRTYTNSIIINKTVIVPTYETQYDTTALRIYRNAMPGYNVVGIESNSIIPMLGAIHCIVKEVGAENPIFISHASPEMMSGDASSYQIKAYMKTNSGLANADVYWANAASSPLVFSAAQMTETVSDTFVAYIPQQPAESTVYYYLSAESNLGKTITKPITAPDGYYQFEISLPTANEEPEQPAAMPFVLLQNYPNPFNLSKPTGGRPLTTIGYYLPGESEVVLKVYTVFGREVKTIVEGDQSAGYQSAPWDGTNNDGQTVSSGVYLYRLQANDKVQGSRMLVLK